MDAQLIGIILMIVFGLTMVIGLILIGFRRRDEVDPLQARLAEYAMQNEMPASLEEIEMSLSRRERILVPFFEALANFLLSFTPEQQIETVRFKLIQAGKDQSPASFFAQRIMMTVVFGALGFMLGFVLNDWGFLQAAGATVGLSVLGYYFPMLAINGQIRRRQERILRALPDALDLLVICVEAGLGFDTAMGKVYEKWDNEVAEAFGRVLQEISLGVPRSQALREMSKRMDVPDVTSFVAAIIQAEQLGVSIARVLRVQSDQMRVKRRQRAQEKAQQAPVKIIFPLVFLIFPSIWIVLMGPAVITVIELQQGGSV